MKTNPQSAEGVGVPSLNGSFLIFTLCEYLHLRDQPSDCGYPTLLITGRRRRECGVVFHCVSVWFGIIHLIVMFSDTIIVLWYEP